MRPNFSLVHVGCAGFFLTLAVLFFSRSARDRFYSVFSLPVPANQPVIKPFDSIRGFAALWVALFHSWQWLKPVNNPGTSFIIEQGYLAVPLFVAISAFLIYRTLKPVSSLQDLADYFKRRWLRIYPLFFVTVTVIVLSGYGPAALSGKRLLAEFSMLRLFGYPKFLNPPAWSLYVEEGFYIAAPLWFFIWRKRAALGAILSYAAVCVILAYRPSPELDLVRFFCVGILLTQAIDYEGPINVWLKWSILAVGLGLGFITLSSQIPLRPYYYFYFPEPTTRHFFAIAVLCVLWASVKLPRVNDLLSFFPFRFLGIISYSIYLWHSVLITAGTQISFDGSGGVSPNNLYLLGAREILHGPASFYTIYASAIVFYSALSYAFIERPFLLLRRKIIRRANAVTAPIG